MQNLVDAVTVVVSPAIGWMGQFATAITQSPILLMGCVAVPLVGLGCGLLARVLRRKV